MDNVTHSLFGYALARIACDRGRVPEKTARAAIWSAVLASNLPDLDFVVGFFTPDRKLAYLLHHRGHTHTLLWVLPLSLVAAWVVVRASGLRANRRQAWALSGISVAGGLLHIGFDALNNYGVHAYHPFDDRWYYGDVLFIVEPWLLAPLIAFLAARARAAWSRAVAWLLGVLLLALVWTTPELVTSNRLLISAFLLITGCVQWFLHARSGERADLTVLFGVPAVVLTFAFGSRAADAKIRAAVADGLLGGRLIDVVRTPTPGNPLCWNVLLGEREGDLWRVHRGTVALSLWFSVDDCRFRSPFSTTARYVPSPFSGSGARLGVRLDGFYEGALAELRALASRQCRVGGVLRFARTPFWSASPAGVVIGDLRYDNSPGLGFSEIEVDPTGDGRCPFWLPPWVPPRADLLEGP